MYMLLIKSKIHQEIYFIISVPEKITKLLINVSHDIILLRGNLSQDKL